MKGQDPRRGDRALIVGFVPHPLSHRYNNTPCLVLTDPVRSRFVDLFAGQVHMDTCSQVQLHDGEKSWFPTRYLVRIPPDEEAQRMFGEAGLPRRLPAKPEEAVS